MNRKTPECDRADKSGVRIGMRGKCGDLEVDSYGEGGTKRKEWSRRQVFSW